MQCKYVACAGLLYQTKKILKKSNVPWKYNAINKQFQQDIHANVSSLVGILGNQMLPKKAIMDEDHTEEDEEAIKIWHSINAKRCRLEMVKVD